MAKSAIAELIISLKDNVSKGLANIGGRLDKMAVNVEKSKFVWAGLAAGVAAAGTMFVSAASKMEGWQISFETMLGSASKAKTLMNEVRQFAAQTPFELTEVIRGTKGLLAFGIETEKLIPTLKNLGDVSAGLGVPMERLILNFGQVAAQGKLTGREIRDFAVAGVPLLKTLADQMGTTEAAIQDMASAGKIGFADVEKAFASMSGEGGKFANLMQRQMVTLPGMISNVKDQFFQLSATLGEKIVPIAKQVAQVFLGVITWVNDLSPRTQTLMLVIGGLVGVFSAVLAAAGALVAFAPAIAAAWFAIGGPISLIVLAVAGLVSAFVIFQEEVAVVFDFVKSLFGIFVNAVQSYVDIVKEKFASIIDPIIESITEVILSITELWDMFAEEFLEKFDEFKELILEKWEEFKESLGIIWEFITGKILGEADKQATGVQNANKKIVKDTKDALKQLLKDWEEAKKKKQEAQTKADAEDIKQETKQLAQKQVLTTRELGMTSVMRTEQDKMRKLEAQRRRQELLDKASDMQASFQTIATLTQSSNRTLFNIGKAAAMANAVVNIAKGITGALSIPPPPVGFALAALVAAAGAVQIGTIASQSLATGGVVMPTSGGTFANIAEAGKAEAVIPLEDDAAQEKLSEALGGGGTIVNINAGVIVADDESLRALASMIDEKLFELKENNETVAI